jgi:hypothetical protein
MPGKRIQFDEETWGAVDLLARDRMMDFQELADEAFRDLLKKYNRPTDLGAALRRSAREATSTSSGHAAPAPADTRPRRAKSRPAGKRRGTT